MNQEIELPEVETLIEVVQALRLEIEELKKKVLPQKMWYSREDLATLKSMKISALYNKPWLLPPGLPLKQGGTDRWSYQQVWESGWIWKSDEDLRPKARRVS